MEPIFFDSWQPLFRTALIGIMAYLSMLILLRMSGRRTLSKMNAFDLVVTVTLGSALATVLLSENVTLAQGALAFVLVIAMQYVVTWTSLRISWFRKIVTGEPALLLHEGTYLADAMRRARVTQEEVRAAVRAAGLEQLEQAKAVVLETDGSFSVVKHDRR